MKARIVRRQLSDGSHVFDVVVESESGIFALEMSSRNSAEEMLDIIEKRKITDIYLY